MGEALKGIARLAAESDVLEAKRRVTYLEIPTRRFIGRNSNPRMPFPWTINSYRGCEFGCKYCYARYAHEFLELRRPEDFETRIFAKQFSERAFRKELRRIPAGDWIAIGTATDPYQPAERRFRITRGILEVFAGEQGRQFSITTKSDLVARDCDLLSDIARSNIVHIHMTVTTIDTDLARLVEPYAPRPDLRLQTVEKLSKAGVRVGVFANPIMPMINDSVESIEAVAARAVTAGAKYFSGNVVFLKPCSQAAFMPFLKERFPALLPKYQRSFAQNAYLKGAYPDEIRARLRNARQKFGLTDQLSDYVPEFWPQQQQLVLFPENIPMKT